MLDHIKKLLKWTAPLAAVAVGFIDSEKLSFSLLVALGFISPRLFILSAIGFLVGPFWSETRPLPNGQLDGFSDPSAVLPFALFMWLPIALALTGGGALLHIIVNRICKKLSK